MEYEDLNDFMTYIWVRNISKKFFSVELDPEVSEDDIAFKFNKMNTSNRKIFNYEEISKIVGDRLGKKVY